MLATAATPSRRAAAGRARLESVPNPFEGGGHHREEHQRGQRDVAQPQQGERAEHGREERPPVGGTTGEQQDGQRQLHDEQPLARGVEGRRSPLDDVTAAPPAAAAARREQQDPQPERTDGAEQHARAGTTQRPPLVRSGAAVEAATDG